MDTVDTITKTFTWQVANPETPTPENWHSFIGLAPNTRCPDCEGAGRVGRHRCRTCGGQGEIGGCDAT